VLAAAVIGGVLLYRRKANRKKTPPGTPILLAKICFCLGFVDPMLKTLCTSAVKIDFL